jgi:hypothetical protein
VAQQQEDVAMAPRQQHHDHVREDDPVITEAQYADEMGLCRSHQLLVLQIDAINAKLDTVIEAQSKMMTALLGDMVKDETGLIPWRRGVDNKIKEVYRIAAVVGGGLIVFAGTWLWNLLTHQATIMVGK